MKRGCPSCQNPPTFVQFSAFWIIAHICSLRTYSCLAAKTASACEETSSWSELQASAFAGEAEHVQSPGLQDHWDRCSQLLWGMLEVAAGHRDAEWTNGVEEGSTCSYVEREGAAGAKNTILGWDACTWQGGWGFAHLAWIPPHFFLVSLDFKVPHSA